MTLYSCVFNHYMGHWQLTLDKYLIVVLYMMLCILLGFTHVVKHGIITIVYNNSNGSLCYGEVEYYIFVTISSSYFVYAYVSQLSPQGSCKDYFQLPHNALDSGVNRIVPVCITDQKVLVDVKNILCKCVLVSAQRNCCVCIPPNTLLLD